MTSRCRDGGESRPRGLIKRKISLFNLQTLPVAKVARLWPTVWLVLWSGANRFIFSARSPLSLCVCCKVDYSQEKAFVIMLLELQQLVKIILQQLQSQPLQMISVWYKRATSDKPVQIMQSLLPHCRTVIAWNSCLHESVYACLCCELSVKDVAVIGWKQMGSFHYTLSVSNGDWTLVFILKDIFYLSKKNIELAGLSIDLKQYPLFNRENQTAGLLILLTIPCNHLLLWTIDFTIKTLNGT